MGDIIVRFKDIPLSELTPAGLDHAAQEAELMYRKAPTAREQQTATYLLNATIEEREARIATRRSRAMGGG